MIKKHPKADLRSSHTILIQFGIICSLLCFIAATNMEIKSERKIIDRDLCCEPDFDPIDLPDQIPLDTPPPPIKPSVFTELPPDSPIEPDPIEFGAIDFDDPIPMPIDPDLKPKREDFTFMPEFMPEMKGGISKLYSEIKYPKQARAADIEGKVFVRFIVNEKGEVENPEIIRGIGGGCDEEVLRAIKLMSFTPGIQNGRFVKVKMNQLVTFKLRN
ncbi:MAG: energy transducer TonB [Balneolaceae bacterium]